MKRRHFLQFTGSTLATLGLTQLDIIQHGDTYAKVLAQNTGRKLALLVGINKYANGMNPLYGCVNDVLLQKNLLIYRFGFNPNDIKILIDEQATRQGILTAFEQHLINQAKPGDTVVFHFSGHGSQVVDPDKDNRDGLNSTLVPIDSGYNASGGVVQDIMGHTLFLLMYALKTDNVTVVLDSCHSGGAKRGNFVVRSRDGGNKFQALPQEFAYQKQWLKRLNLSPQEFIKLRRQGVAKGVVIASAKRDQYAADAPFNDFHAGAFTYIFTQYLWQQTANQSINRAFVDVNRSTKILSSNSGIFQEPEIELNKKQNSNPVIYFTPFNTSYAEAVVTQVKGDKVELWLGGIDARSLEAFNQEAAFSTVNTSSQETGIVKLESRQGLIGKGKFIAGARGNSPIKLGTLLQERIRGIPKNLTLKIGLDNSFDGVTTTQAQQALQAINRVTPLALRQQEVQYIFGLMTETRYRQLQKFGVINLPTVSSLGLFLPSLDQIVTDSFGATNETVTDAVKRLQPKFKSLLAARIVKQMLGNNSTSLLKVIASMQLAGSQKIISKALPTRGITKQANGDTTKPNKPIIQDGEIPKLPVGTQVKFTIENQELVPIYISVLVIDAAGEMAIIFPNNWTASEDAALLPAKDKRIIPGNDDGFKLTIGKPLGITEALIISSTSPLRNSLKALKEIATRGKITRGPIAANNDEFLEITDKLLADLDAGTRGGITVEDVQLSAGVRGVDAKKLATIAIAFEVVG
ncbi:caspase family protein [Calothrix sp. PCC 7507]|uniref:caspase family protein n=1 Tax=Calothrix sp. PCC 7507 TaxID=99598 RepID=UPI00029F48A2|nr:caspase family protein [Calothrix sp. PCC 7507]AFY31633.1 peptidase C14 caspase catalytic subunit p20 [Calothrix sp. PCC 7507]